MLIAENPLFVAFISRGRFSQSSTAGTTAGRSPFAFHNYYRNHTDHHQKTYPCKNPDQHNAVFSGLLCGGILCLRGTGSRRGRLRGCFCCPLQIRQFRHGVDCKNRQRSGQPQEKRTEQRYRIPFLCHAVFPHFPMFFPYFITKQDGKHDRFITIFGYASVRAKTSAKTSPNNSPEYKASSKVFTSVPNSTRRELFSL